MRSQFNMMHTSGGGMANPMTSTVGSGMRPTTTSGGGTTLGRIQAQVQDGNFTSTVYGYIRDYQYDEAIEIVLQQLEEFPRSRAALSLLAYCYYQVGEFGESAHMYQNLVKICPNVEEYRVYLCQALYKAGAYAEASKLCTSIESEQYEMRLTKLQASIAYEQEEIQQTKSFLEKCAPEDPDVIILQGCVLCHEDNYEEALQKFEEAQSALGFKPDLVYNIALTYYRMRQYGPSLKHIAEIIERGIQDHPELNVGSNTEGNEARSVGNSQVLKETALVEAFNLKTAIEFMMKNLSAAKEALTDMPPRLQEELDPVTLHNTALVNMHEDPSNGFNKLNFLLQNPPFPSETFQNLLLFYCKYQYYDLAADVLAENPHLSWKYLSQKNQSLYDFLDGLITAQTSPAEAYRKYDILAQKHIDAIRKLTKKVQEARESGDKDALRVSLRTYDDALDAYLPVLMAQANIYWEIDNYPQETKFREAIRYYEPVVETHEENILNCSAIVLANLCVSYIMTALNDKAEDIMRRMEREEEKLTYSDPEKQPLHLCIVNLVIGTLYCAKGNFEFGISRVIKSLEPYHRKIMTDTWFYAKRCLLALAMNMAKHMVDVKDSTFAELITFFDQADHFGERIPAFVHRDPSKQDASMRNTVRWEARQLKNLFLQLRE